MPKWSLCTACGKTVPAREQRQRKAREQNPPLQLEQHSRCQLHSAQRIPNRSHQVPPSAELRGWPWVVPAGTWPGAHKKL